MSRWKSCLKLANQRAPEVNIEKKTENRKPRVVYFNLLEAETKKKL